MLNVAKAKSKAFLQEREGIISIFLVVSAFFLIFVEFTEKVKLLKLQNKHLRSRTGILDNILTSILGGVSGKK
jgi:hypothetical protein